MPSIKNATIYFDPDNSDALDRNDREADDEGFLRGFLSHADVDAFHFFNAAGRPIAGLEALIARIEQPTKPVNWINRRGRQALADPGCLYRQSPSLAGEAWARRPLGPARYSLCGLVPPLARMTVMDRLAELAIAPLEGWDALICTSRALRASVEAELAAVRDDLTRRLGATRLPHPELTTIPEGVSAGEFKRSQAHRQAWRELLNIPPTAVVALHAGRLSVTEEGNPAVMAMVLERAAQATGIDIYWVVAGWGATKELSDEFHQKTRSLCPSVHYRPVDGRPPEARFSIWSVADFFIAFPDNIEGRCGLTATEAMAAGLPCVVSDWGSHRDIVRHEIEGFRIPIYSPRPGLGRDLAFAHANQWVTPEHYLASAAQMTSIDLRLASEAVSALVSDRALRDRLGAAALQRAVSTFDWSVVIPQYQALWAELAQRRQAAQTQKVPGAPIVDNPRRLDPFRLFAGYPTQALRVEDAIMVTPGLDWAGARTILNRPLAAIGRSALPSIEEAEHAFAYIAAHPQATIAEVVAQFPPPRRSFVERGLLWLVKFGLLILVPKVAPTIS